MLGTWLVLLAVGITLIISGLWLKNRALQRELERERDLDRR